MAVVILPSRTIANKLPGRKGGAASFISRSLSGSIIHCRQVEVAVDGGDGGVQEGFSGGAACKSRAEVPFLRSHRPLRARAGPGLGGWPVLGGPAVASRRMSGPCP